MINFFKKCYEYVKSFFVEAKPVEKENKQEIVLEIPKQKSRSRLRRKDSVLDINTHISENSQELTKSMMASGLEMIKISMATLLSIFVPQYCEESGGTCTLYENFTNLSKFNEFVIAWNFITLGLFIRLTYIANKREAYFISHLDESREKPYNSLEDNLYLYPKYIRRIKEHNLKLKKITKWTIYFFILNIIFSCLLIFYYFYDGFRSATTLIANVLLVSNKLYLLHTICIDCNGPKAMALSTINLTPVSYNVVDAKKVTPEERRRSELEIRIDAVKKVTRKRAFSAPRA